MDSKKTPLAELVCREVCAYYKPHSKEDLACQAVLTFQEFLKCQPQYRQNFYRHRHQPFTDVYSNVLRQFLCQRCDFFLDGCDFADPTNTQSCLPCGGYVAITMVLKDPAVAELLFQQIIPPEEKAVLAGHCALKGLEKPFLYDIKNDELYELNEKALGFLTLCDGSRGLRDLRPDKDFLETCLGERLIEVSQSPNLRQIHFARSPEPSLRYLELQLTHRCNLRCKHCYLGDPSGQDMPLTRVLSVLDAFEDMQGLRVLFSGGEPLLFPEMEALNKALPQYKFRKVLLTNGTLLTAQNPMIWSNFDEIQFSLDGLKQGHEAIRGPHSFAPTVQAIRASRNQGLRISVATMVHRLNLGELERMGRWIHALGAMEWNIDVPCKMGRLTNNAALWVSPEEGAPLLRLAFGGSYHGTEEPFACGYHLCTVTPSGQVLKCGFFPDSPLGSVQEGLNVAWNRCRPVPLSELKCGPCSHMKQCKGGCRFRAPSFFDKDPVMCAFFD